MNYDTQTNVLEGRENNDTRETQSAFEKRRHDPASHDDSRKINSTCQGLKTYDKTVLELILSVFKSTFTNLLHCVWGIEY